MRRDLAAARVAFATSDRTLLRDSHSLTVQDPLKEPGHDPGDRTYTKCAVRGGFEGAAVSTCLLAALHGSFVAPATTLAISIGCVLILSICFALRDYLYYKLEANSYERERARERWELKNYPEGEQREMIDLYEHSGMSSEDAKLVVDVSSKYENFFVDLMMLQELHMVPLDSTPLVNALSTFISFVIFGTFPIAMYLLRLVVTLDAGFAVSWNQGVVSFLELVVSHRLVMTVIIGIATLLTLGYANCHLAVRKSRCIFKMLLIFTVTLVALLTSLTTPHLRAALQNYINIHLIAFP